MAMEAWEEEEEEEEEEELRYPRGPATEARVSALPCPSGGVGDHAEEALAPRGAREDEDRQPEVGQVAGDPGPGAPPHVEVGPPPHGAVLAVLAQRLDLVVEAPELEHRLPYGEGHEEHHPAGAQLALLLELVLDVVEEVEAGRHDDGEADAQEKQHPDEGHPHGGDVNHVGTVIAGRPEGLVRVAPRDAPGSQGTLNDRHHI